MAEGIKVGDFTSRSRILELVFPVGAIYQSFQPKSPAEWLGGTWELLEEGRTLVAASAPETFNPKYLSWSFGGEAEVTLQFYNMPPGFRTPRVEWTDPMALNTVSLNGVAVNADSTVEGYMGVDRTQIKEGFGIPVNNMPPYIATYMWCRIA